MSIEIPSEAAKQITPLSFNRDALMILAGGAENIGELELTEEHSVRKFWQKIKKAVPFNGINWKIAYTMEYLNEFGMPEMSSTILTRNPDTRESFTRYFQFRNGRLVSNVTTGTPMGPFALFLEPVKDANG